MRLKQLDDPRLEAERLSAQRKPSHRWLAELWLEIGDSDMAPSHALLAYEEAWADGPPYTRRYDLERAQEVLMKGGARVADAPYRASGKRQPLPWEDGVEAAIGRLRGVASRKE